MKIWALDRNADRIFIGSKFHSTYSNELAMISWHSINAPFRIYKIDASIAFDEMSDLDNLKFFKN